MRVIFEHLQFADWTTWCPFVAFGISFAVFVAWLWWAFHLPQKNLDRMAQLPLDESSAETTIAANHSSNLSVPHAKQ